MSNWIHVTCFTEDVDYKIAHFSVRVTKKGKVNLTDAKRFLGTKYKVPLRYSDGGIRKCNPDIGWPEEYLYKGDPPEVYGFAGEKFVAELREKLIEHSPAKMTKEEISRLTELDRVILAGTASDCEIEERTAILAEIAKRPITLDEW